MTRERVLVVDDNPLNLKLLRVLLSGEGFEVHAAESAEDALTLLERVRPRLILMDIQLPGMDGLALTRRIRADPATRDIAIVAVTAYAMKGDEERARQAGCDLYLAKPLDTRALAGLLEKVLGARDR